MVQHLQQSGLLLLLPARSTAKRTVHCRPLGSQLWWRPSPGSVSITGRDGGQRRELHVAERCTLLCSCAYAVQEEFDVLWPEGDNLRLLGKDM